MVGRSDVYGPSGRARNGHTRRPALAGFVPLQKIFDAQTDENGNWLAWPAACRFGSGPPVCSRSAACRCKKFSTRKLMKMGTAHMINSLRISHRSLPPARVRKRPKGWTPERRARQAANIRLSKPWQRSTGPRTASGKARVAMNALRHGQRSREWLMKARRIRNAIRLCARTVLLARLLLAERDRAAFLEASGLEAPASERSSVLQPV